MDDTICEEEYQVLNWVRKIAVMNNQELSAHFKKLSKTAKKQLASIPVINSQPKTASFPFVLSLPASGHQNDRLSPASTARNESPTRMDIVPVLLTSPNRTTRSRRKAFNDSESEEDKEYRPRIRPRELLVELLQLLRYAETHGTTSYQRQPIYETAQMIE
ncbi:hypothetical protein BDEG_26291 [Batrachochytrium dendrobatidis JEL423]|nr:hypothetical protein BDEG_26291 [Batrachochytrium dendrobatidis JEL423]